MIELYGNSSPNVAKVNLMLEEVGLDHTLHYVNLAKGEQFTPEFLAMSPNNKVPVLVDSNGPGGQPFTVIESGAILVYLAEKTGKLWSTEPRKRSVVMQWLMVQMGTVGPMFGQYNHFNFFAPDVEYGRKRYESEVFRVVGVLDARLKDFEWLGGSQYSIADIATAPWIRNALINFPIFRGKSEVEAFENTPALGRWYARVNSRPAVKRALERFDEWTKERDRQAFGSMTPEKTDQLVGRGKFQRTA